LPSTAFAHAAPAADPSTMTDEEKMEQAKSLFAEGDAALAEGNNEAALAKFEEAYNVYAPSIHVFNFNIGQAAYAAGDCVKAKKAYQRFLDLVPEHPSRGDAQEKLLEIERSKCAEQQQVAPTPAAAEPAPIATGPTGLDNEDAPELSSRRDQRAEAAAEERKRNREGKASPLLISGAVLTAFGAASLIGGGVSAGIANQRADELADLSSPGPTGFPEGDYSDDSTFNLDRNELPAANNAAVALFVIGGVMTAAGVSLIVVDVVRNKKKGPSPETESAEAAREHRRRVQLTGLGPAWFPGGGGAVAGIRF
jgi:tetratricopeptide (TPR) repeat protein